MNPAFEQLLEVQSTDQRLRQLRHRLASHPLSDSLAAAEQVCVKKTGLVKDIEDQIAVLDREQKRLSDEVAGIEAKRSDTQGKIYGGSVTASKELLALQDEEANLLTRQQGVEDSQLELMEQREELIYQRDTARSDLNSATEAKMVVEAELAVASDEINNEIDALAAGRGELAKSVSPEMLARYEKLADEFGGLALATIVDGRCDGCHIQLSAVARDQLHKAPDDNPSSCEECGRLLVG